MDPDAQAERLVDADRSDAEGYWAAQLLGDDWLALYRFVWRAAGPVLAEVHVVPRVEPIDWRPRSARWRETRPGTWLDLLNGASGHLDRVPRGGLTSRELRGLQPTVALTDALMDPSEVFRLGVLHPHPGWQLYSDAALRAHQEVRGLVPPSKGRALTRQQRLALVAAQYAEGGAAGSRRRNAEIAQNLGRSATQIRDDVYAARREGLLSEGPGRGRAGGSFTTKGPAIPNELGRTQPAPASDP